MSPPKQRHARRARRSGPGSAAPVVVALLLPVTSVLADALPIAFPLVMGADEAIL